MDEDRLDERARQAFSLAGPPVDPDAFCEAVLAQKADGATQPDSRPRAKSRRRKTRWRIALATTAIVVVAAGIVAAIPSTRAAAGAFFGFDSRSVDTQFGYLPDQSRWSKKYSVLIPPQSLLNGGNECLGQSLHQNGAQFVQYKLTTDTGKPLPSGTTVEIKNHGDAVLQTGLSGTLETTSDDAVNEIFGTPKDTTWHPSSGSGGGGLISGSATQAPFVDWTCDKKTGTIISGTWSYGLVPIIHTANGSSTDNSHAVHVSSGTWSYDTSTEKTKYGMTTGKTNPFTTGAEDFSKVVLNAALGMSGGTTAKTISFHDAISLTWVSNGIRVEILSNLSKKELIKVAEGFSIGTEFPSLNVDASTTTTSLDPTSSAAADEVAKRVAASLVTVKASGSKYGLDSVNLGVVYSADGLILISDTYDCTLFKVTLADGETVTAKLVGKDKTTHAELLRVRKSGLSPVRLASEKPKVGEWMALIANKGSSLISAPASIVELPDPDLNWSSPVWSTVRVKPAKWQDNVVPVAFDKQGDVVGLVTASGEEVGVGKIWLVLPADKVAAAVAKLLGS